MKILLAAPDGWATDALCGLLKKLDPGHEIDIVPDPQALPASYSAQTDYLLLDLDTSADAPATVAAASRLYPRSQIVAMGTSLDNAFVEAVLEAGALGYLPKSLSETVTLGMLRMIIDGANSSPGKPAAGQSGKRAVPREVPADDPAQPWLEFGLTGRQTDVIALACEGKSNLAIAKQLGITEGVVKLHMTAIFKALKVHNRSEAILLASRFRSINFRQVKQAEGGRLDLDWLLGHMVHERLAKGTVLFQLGEPGREIFYLQRGTILLKEIGAEIGSGTMLGEIGIFSPSHKRTCSAVCVTDVDVFKLTSDQVKRLYVLNPQFALYIVHLIATRLMADRTRNV